MPEKVKVRINGKFVDAEMISPEEAQNFFNNPRVQDTAMFVAGMGLGLYKGAKGLVGILPNPTKTRLSRAMPYAAASILSFVLAPALGKAKIFVRVGGALLAVKSGYELMRRLPSEKEYAEQEITA
jgi:hypothetical protein